MTGKINWNRWLIASLAAGSFIWLFEGIAGMSYLAEMQASLEKLNLPMEMSPKLWVISVIASLLSGMVLMFFYVAARPRFGPGPKTAVMVAVVLWIGSYFLALLGYEMIGLFPTSMLVNWGGVGFAEMVLGGLLGAWIYREP